MKILYKCLLTLLLPVAMIWMVAFYANALFERHIRATAVANSVTQASMVMGEVDRLIDTEVSTWQALCHSQLFLNTLRQCNHAFAQRDDVAAALDEEDERWQQSVIRSGQPATSEAVTNELAT